MLEEIGHDIRGPRGMGVLYRGGSACIHESASSGSCCVLVAPPLLVGSVPHDIFSRAVGGSSYGQCRRGSSCRTGSSCQRGGAHTMGGIKVLIEGAEAVLNTLLLPSASVSRPSAVVLRSHFMLLWNCFCSAYVGSGTI